MKTVHDLEFYDMIWPKDPNWHEFKIGTVTGLWQTIQSPIPAYQILSFLNRSPGNGHLEDVFQWFENSCKRDNYCLIILEVWNQTFKKHLIEKRGFQLYQKEDESLIKIFK